MVTWNPVGMYQIHMYVTHSNPQTFQCSDRTVFIMFIRENFVQYNKLCSEKLCNFGHLQIWNWLAKYLYMYDKDEVRIRAWGRELLIKNFPNKFLPIYSSESDDCRRQVLMYRKN